MAENSSKLPKMFWFAFAVSALSGVVALLVLWYSDTRAQEGSPYVFWHWVLEMLTPGLVTAFLLAATVDLYLKRKIVDDVFKAAVGYLLPPELRREMHWIHDIPFISYGQHQEFYLSQAANGAIQVSEHTVLRLKNITGGPKEFTPVRTIRQSPFGASHITHYQAKYGDQVRSMENHSMTVTTTERYVRVWGEPINLPPGEEVSVTFGCDEIDPIGGEYYCFFSWAAHRPQVRVEVEPGLDLKYEVSYKHREQEKMESLGGNNFELPATLLPRQAIRVSWWKEVAGDGQEAETGSSRVATDQGRLRAYPDQGHSTLEEPGNSTRGTRSKSASNIG